MKETDQNIKSELRDELTNILKYWCENTLDTKNEGFYGRITHDNQIIKEASKGIILNTRILWSFASSSNFLKTNEYSYVCDRAFEYLRKYFIDKTFHGVFWEVDYTGKVINSRKQIYAQAFAIYALSEYHIFSKNKEARHLAINLFKQIENHAKDKAKSGYFEAFSQKWSILDDMRLSNKDMNAAKSMNTHLHILEAYTSLCNIYESSELKNALKDLVEIFLNIMLNKNNHFDLFYNEQWDLLSNTISYGHDIETCWLLIEAARQTEDTTLLQRCKDTAVKVADTFLKEGIDNDGAVMNEHNLTNNIIDTDRHWWPQVEAMIGLTYAYNLTTDETYLQKVSGIWDFTKKHMIDHQHGEWHFRVDKKGNIYTDEDKVSMWKAPYHVSRACIIINNLL